MTNSETIVTTSNDQVRISAIKVMRLDDGNTLIRIDTDAGVCGYGECGNFDSGLVRAVVAEYSEGGRLPHLGLLGKNPLAVRLLHHNMFYAYRQRERHMQVLSAIDMAIWDLVGKLLNQPVSMLLGGRFREDVALYSHYPNGGDVFDHAFRRDTVQALLGDPQGFRTFKVDFHNILGLPMQQTVPTLSAAEIRTLTRGYELIRQDLGDDVDIIVHCHCELDVPSAIALGKAVAPIRPLYFEDPLQPEFSQNWLTLRQAIDMPMMTGENLALAEAALPFMSTGAVDILQPDIVNAGGITGVKAMADAASLYRMPIALHNVSGLLQNLASAQVAAAVFDCPLIECRQDAGRLAWATTPLQISDGRMQIPLTPGLGFEPDNDYLRAHRYAGEDWWD